jgi:hypothetical protein
MIITQAAADDMPASARQTSSGRIREVIFAKCDFSHIWRRPRSVKLSRGIQHFSNQICGGRRIDKIRTIRSIWKQNTFDTIASGTPESAMSEVEYDLLLEAVQTAVAPAPEDDFVVQTQRSYPSPRAANDNGASWPLVPFPEGWYAAS